VPVGNALNIRLTNNLASGTSTSLVILGQIGGSAGNPTRDAAPVNHPPQTTTTWPANAAARRQRLAGISRTPGTPTSHRQPRAPNISSPARIFMKPAATPLCRFRWACTVC
jgi:hypothetical protein